MRSFTFRDANEVKTECSRSAGIPYSVADIDLTRQRVTPVPRRDMLSRYVYYRLPRYSVV